MEKIGKFDNFIRFGPGWGVTGIAIYFHTLCQTFSPYLVKLKIDLAHDPIVWYIPPQKCTLLYTKIHMYEHL